MSEYLDEYEQGQAVKKWFKDNGSSIIFGVVLGLGGIFGWNQFKDWRSNAQSAAADAYRQMMITVESEDFETAAALAESVRSEFAKSPYAALTALEQAKLALNDQDTDAAINHLRYAAENGKPAPVAALASIRLARVLISTEQYDQALTVLDAISDDSYAAVVQELRGDAYLSKDDPQQALAAYQRSMAASGGSVQPLLQLKIDDLRQDDEPVVDVVESAGEEAS